MLPIKPGVRRCKRMCVCTCASGTGACVFARCVLSKRIRVDPGIWTADLHPGVRNASYLSLSLTHTLSLFLTHTLFLSHTIFFSLTHTHSHSFFLCHTHTHSSSLSHTHDPSRSISHAVLLSIDSSRSLHLSHTQTHSRVLPQQTCSWTCPSRTASKPSRSPPRKSSSQVKSYRKRVLT